MSSRGHKSNSDGLGVTSQSMLVGVLKRYAPKGGFGDFEKFNHARTPEKEAVRRWKNSSINRKRPITLPTKPFDHNEGQS